MGVRLTFRVAPDARQPRRVHDAGAQLLAAEAARGHDEVAGVRKAQPGAPVKPLKLSGLALGHLSQVALILEPPHLYDGQGGRLWMQLGSGSHLLKE